MSNQVKEKRYGQLSCIEIQPQDPHRLTVVLLHGFGADATDLATLAQFFRGLRGVRWIFPHGHLTVPIGPHIEGRAWFPIPLSELQAQAASGAPLDFANQKPPGLGRARALVEEMLIKLGDPVEKIVLGGFSQGAMLSTEVVIHLKESLRGLVILSGTLLNQQEWLERAKLKSGFEFFQSHGRFDQVLGHKQAQNLEGLLRLAGWQGQLQTFEGGHEIPIQVLQKVEGYLKKRL